MRSMRYSEKRRIIVVDDINDNTFERVTLAHTVSLYGECNLINAKPISLKHT